MSVHIFPKGNDRSWTRGFYYAINRLYRRMLWEYGAEEILKKAIEETFIYGRGVIKLKP